MASLIVVCYLVDHNVYVPLVFPLVFLFSLSYHQKWQLACRLEYVLVVLILWHLLRCRYYALAWSALLLKCYLAMAILDF